MTIVEGIGDCVVNIPFVDVVLLKSSLDFGKFVQLLGKIVSRISSAKRGGESTLVGVLFEQWQEGWSTCRQ